MTPNDPTAEARYAAAFKAVAAAVEQSVAAGARPDQICSVLLYHATDAASWYDVRTAADLAGIRYAWADAIERGEHRAGGAR